MEIMIKLVCQLDSLSFIIVFERKQRFSQDYQDPTF